MEDDFQISPVKSHASTTVQQLWRTQNSLKQISEDSDTLYSSLKNKNTSKNIKFGFTNEFAIRRRILHTSE